MTKKPSPAETMSALLPSLTRQSVIASAGATLFEQHPRSALIRRLYDDATETWWFSVIDLCTVRKTNLI